MTAARAATSRARKPAEHRRSFSASRGGIWAILFPIILLVGLRVGVFTPSEIGAFAVVYAIVIGVVVYRKLRRPASAKRSTAAWSMSAR